MTNNCTSHQQSISPNEAPLGTVLVSSLYISATIYLAVACAGMVVNHCKNRDKR